MTTLNNVIKQFGMEGESPEMMHKMNVQQREDILPQFIIMILIIFCLIFLK